MIKSTNRLAKFLLSPSSSKGHKGLVTSKALLTFFGLMGISMVLGLEPIVLPTLLLAIFMAEIFAPLLLLGVIGSIILLLHHLLPGKEWRKEIANCFNKEARMFFFGGCGLVWALGGVFLWYLIGWSGGYFVGIVFGEKSVWVDLARMLTAVVLSISVIWVCRKKILRYFISNLKS